VRQRRLVTTLIAHRALRFDVNIPDQVIVFDPSIQNQPQQFGCWNGTGC
jgi:hypothetical protein